MTSPEEEATLRQTQLPLCLQQMLQQECCTDLTLCCQGRRFRAHRVLLSACSPYLQEILLIHRKKKHATLILQDVQPEDVESLLCFLYSGEVTLPEERLESFISLARQLRISIFVDQHLYEKSITLDRHPTVQEDGRLSAGNGRRKREIWESGNEPEDPQKVEMTLDCDTKIAAGEGPKDVLKESYLIAKKLNALENETSRYESYDQFLSRIDNSKASRLETIKPENQPLQTAFHCNLNYQHLLHSLSETALKPSADDNKLNLVNESGHSRISPQEHLLHYFHDQLNYHGYNFVGNNFRPKEKFGCTTTPTEWPWFGHGPWARPVSPQLPVSPILSSVISKERCGPRTMKNSSVGILTPSPWAQNKVPCVGGVRRPTPKRPNLISNYPPPSQCEDLNIPISCLIKPHIYKEQDTARGQDALTDKTKDKLILDSDEIARLQRSHLRATERNDATKTQEYLCEQPPNCSGAANLPADLPKRIELGNGSVVGLSSEPADFPDPVPEFSTRIHPDQELRPVTGVIPLGKTLPDESEKPTEPSPTLDYLLSNDTNNNRQFPGPETKEEPVDRSLTTPGKLPFSCQKLLEKHPSNPETKGYVCTICKQYFAHKDLWLAHQRIHAETGASGGSNGGTCGGPSDGKKSLEHICTDCGKKFVTRASLKVHMRTHTGEKPFHCTECGKQFSQLRNYKYHRSVHEGTKEFAATCPECGKYFNDRGYLSSHMKIHRNRKEYGCEFCGKSFNQRVAYNMHVRIHTGEKPHVCPHCGKCFSRKMLLKQHLRIHTGEKPFQCVICQKAFADRSNMTLHMRLHSGVKPYTCTVCSKSFTKKHHLKTHMNYHTGVKPYSCQKCGLKFSQSSNMRTHYKKCASLPPKPATPVNLSAS